MNLKVDIKDLDKAIRWFKENTNMQFLNLSLRHHLDITGFDRYDKEVIISIYEAGSYEPKKTQTEILKL